MKKRFGKQILCYVLSTALFASILQVPIGAAGVSSYHETGQRAVEENQSELAEEKAAAGQTEKSLDFDLNGGFFTEGYKTPESYPASKLPDETVISKPGYAFAGWYDNKELSGEAVTEVDDSYTGSLLLYAKWTDPYYYVDIPKSTVTDGSEVKLSGKADGLYEQEAVRVSIHSENNWNLKNQNALLSYQLKEKETKLILENDVPVINLTPANKSVEKTYVCEVTGEPETAGQYQDTLTFDIGHETPD